MKIELIEKRVKTKGVEFSYCLVLYLADKVSMYQYATLNNDLPDEVLIQMCETWAKRHKKINDLKQGSWYWVKIKDKWSPAQYDIHAAGGWTNEDTWEDFDKEVVDWQLIIPPNETNSVEGDTMVKLIKSEPIEITELRIRKTFEYYVGDERMEYSLIASQEFWADEQMAIAIVEGKIKQAIEDYKKANS